MRGSSAQKIKLTSYDDLFGSNEQASGEAITSVPISQLHPFKGHPFRVLDDAKMQETVESVKKYGILWDTGSGDCTPLRRRRLRGSGGTQEMESL